MPPLPPLLPWPLPDGPYPPYPSRSTRWGLNHPPAGFTGKSYPVRWVLDGTDESGTDVDHLWLNPDDMLEWLKLKPGAAKTGVAELCRKAAAAWIEDQRRDLWDNTDPEAPVFHANDRLVMAGMLAAARLYARSDSPNGVVAFDELGAGSILSRDPDVMRLVGRARPRVG